MRCRYEQIIFNCLHEFCHKICCSKTTYVVLTNIEVDNFNTWFCKEIYLNILTFRKDFPRIMRGFNNDLLQCFPVVTLTYCNCCNRLAKWISRRIARTSSSLKMCYSPLWIAISRNENFFLLLKTWIQHERTINYVIRNLLYNYNVPHLLFDYWTRYSEQLDWAKFIQTIMILFDSQIVIDAREILAKLRNIINFLTKLIFEVSNLHQNYQQRFHQHWPKKNIIII